MQTLHRVARILSRSRFYATNKALISDPTKTKENWSREIMDLLQLQPVVKGKPTQERPAIFVGNHLSYLDIPLLMTTVHDVCFVAKQELSSWPIFGTGAKRLGTVFVKRGNSSAQNQVYQGLKLALREERKAIGLFPSGTTCLDESKPWKFGAFRLAHELNIPLQVFRIRYSPLRRVAFIDKDLFPVHLWGLCSGKPLEASLEFAEPVRITNPEKECVQWQAWASAKDASLV